MMCIFIHCSLCLGACLIISSTLSICSAASDALLIAVYLTFMHSMTPSFFMQPIAPICTSTPALVLPFTISERKSVISSLASSPAFSHTIIGSCLIALAYPSIANAFLPDSLAAKSLTLFYMLISLLPPP